MNRIVSFTKDKKNRLFVVGFFMIAIMAMGAFIHSFKIIDPADPRFNPDHFSYNDYGLTAETRAANLPQVFKIMFPAGTSRGYVERILVRIGGARVRDEGASFNGYKFIRYQERTRKLYSMWHTSPKYIFIYDPDNKLLNIRINDQPEIFSDQMTELDIYKTKIK